MYPQTFSDIKWNQIAIEGIKTAIGSVRLAIECVSHVIFSF